MCIGEQRVKYGRKSRGDWSPAESRRRRRQWGHVIHHSSPRDEKRKSVRRTPVWKRKGTAVLCNGRAGVMGLAHEHPTPCAHMLLRRTRMLTSADYVDSCSSAQYCAARWERMSYTSISFGGSTSASLAGTGDLSVYLLSLSCSWCV